MPEADPKGPASNQVPHPLPGVNSDSLGQISGVTATGTFFALVATTGTFFALVATTGAFSALVAATRTFFALVAATRTFFALVAATFAFTTFAFFALFACQLVASIQISS